MDTWAGVIMAAGKGTRMRSKVPKVFHKLCGRELLMYPVDALRGMGANRIVVVVSPENREGVERLLGDSAEYITQGQPLGTGHALLQAARLLERNSNGIIALNADSPLISASTLTRLSSRHLSTDATITLLTATSPSWDDMGRVVRDEAGNVIDVLEASEQEEASASPSEINGGAYCFKAPWLWDNLQSIQKDPTGEFYLTSLVAVAASQEARIEALVSDAPQEVFGVNNRVQLARAEAALRQHIRERWMLEGVSMLDPASIVIDASVELGQDTVIYPNTMVLGSTKVGSDCSLGPNSMIQDSVIGDRCKVTASFLEGAILEESVDVGPFSHLRPGAYLEKGVHLGNFAEIKNSRLGSGTRMGHVGYVGDASIGANVNLSAGMITCNYDGVTKHHTIVEKGAFIGCDTMLVAPIKVGAGAMTGAGSVVIKDVPARRLAVGVPATIRESKRIRS